MRSNWYAFAALMHRMPQKQIGSLTVFSKNENFGDYIDLTGYLKRLIKHRALLCFSSKSQLHLVHNFVKLHFECSLLFSAAVVGFVSIRHTKKKISECDCFSNFRRLILSVYLFGDGYGSILLL